MKLISHRGKSDYLDNLDVIPGDIVVCKSDITEGYFTPKKSYKVLPNGMLLDDDNQLVRPSARFYAKEDK